MTHEELEKQKATAVEIVKRYNGSLSQLQDHATAKELKAVMMWVANNANHLQRVTMGLDHPD